MRSIVAIAAVAALSACTTFDAESLGTDPNLPPDGDDFAACIDDGDCILSASSCCSCPTFASHVEAGLDCGTGPECPADPMCAPSAAVCSEGLCRLRCDETPATVDCDQGFAVDPAGCTIDMCAASEPECQIDSDCARTPADCCGCELGGSDTAVPVSALPAHRDALGCAGDSFCPGINSCDEQSVAQCLGGTCRLVSGVNVDVPLPVCGIGGQACAEGETCVLNHESAPPGVAVCGQL